MTVTEAEIRSANGTDRIDKYNELFQPGGAGDDFYKNLAKNISAVDLADDTKLKDYIILQYNQPGKAFERLYSSGHLDERFFTPRILSYIRQRVEAHRTTVRAAAPLVASVETRILRQEISSSGLSPEAKTAAYVIGGLIALWGGNELLEKMGVIGKDENLLGMRGIKLGIAAILGTIAVSNSSAINELTTHIPVIGTRRGWFKDVSSFVGRAFPETHQGKILETLKGRLTGDENEKLRQAELYIKASDHILGLQSDISDARLGGTPMYKDAEVAKMVTALHTELNRGKPLGSPEIKKADIVRNLQRNLPDVRDMYLGVTEQLGVTPPVTLNVTEFNTLPGRNFKEKFEILKSRIDSILTLVESVEGFKIPVTGVETGWNIIAGNKRERQEKDLKMTAELPGAQWASLTGAAKRQDLPQNELKQLILEWGSVTGRRNLTYTSGSLTITLEVV